MYISLISPLKIQECVSRLEEARKRETVSYSREFTPPQCKIKGTTFTLRKNYGKYVPFMHGELSEAPDGTVITYSMEIDSVTGQFSSFWLVIALPLASCFVIAIILDGLTKGFSWNSFLAIVVAIAIPSFYFLQRKIGVRQSELDKKEMLEFLQKTLDAKPRLP